MPLSKEEIGLLVKEARLIKGKKIGEKFTQGDLADAINKSRSYIGDIETGRIYPSYKMLASIANACDVPLSFFGDTDPYLEITVSKKFPHLNDQERRDFVSFIKHSIHAPFGTVDWDLDTWMSFYSSGGDYSNDNNDNEYPNFEEGYVSEFKSPLDAILFILKNSKVSSYGGYDVSKMSEDELKQFANELLEHLKLLGYKYKK